MKELWNIVRGYQIERDFAIAATNGERPVIIHTTTGLKLHSCPVVCASAVRKGLHAASTNCADPKIVLHVSVEGILGGHFS